MVALRRSVPGSFYCWVDLHRGNAQHATNTTRAEPVIAHTTTGDAVSVVVVVERFMAKVSAAQTRAGMKKVYGTP